MFRKTKVLLLILLCFTKAEAQFPKLKNYTVADGLPSSEVYDVFQDSKGYIWFGTDQGISRFDGHTFKNFSFEEGLPNNTVFELYEDRKNRIWFRTYSGDLGYIFNSKIKLIPSNSEIKKILNNGIVSSIAVDSGDTLWLGLFLGNGYLKIYNDFKKVNYLKVEDAASVITIPDIGFIKNLKTYETPYTDPYFALVKNGRLVLRESIKDVKGFQPSLFYSSDGKKELFASNYTLHEIQNSRFKDPVTLSNVITRTYYDKEGNLWVGVFNGGVLFFKNGDLSKSPVSYLSTTTVTSILQDLEGSFWFATTDAGVYYMVSKEVLNYSEETGLSSNKVLSLLSLNKDGVVAGMRNGKVNLIKNQKIETFDFKTNGEENFINSLIQDSKGTIWVGGTSGQAIVKSDFKEKYFLNDEDGNLIYVKDVCKGRSGNIWMCNSTNLVNARNENGKYKVKTIKLKQRGFTVCEDHTGKVWIGGNLGLNCFTNDSLIDYSVKDPIFNFRINDIKEHQDRSLFLASAGKGIIIIKDGVINHINKKNGLASNNCKTLFIDGDQIWVGTEKGVSRIIKTRNNTYTIDNFSESAGLISREVNEIVKAGDLIWVATNQGLTSINTKNFKINKTPPPVYVTSVSILDKKQEPRLSFKLNHKENFIKINFTGISFKDAENLKYLFKLEGIDAKWIQTNHNSVQYTTLPSGKFKFTVYAINGDGIKSSIPATIYFDIATPIWKTWWFFLLIALLIATIIVFVFRYRFQLLKNREEEKSLISRKVSEMHMKALRAQINPHFIFNSMNSIQYFIVNNHPESAQKYLTKFSRLMRSVLENSENNYIPLAQEVNTLQLYLELEQLRFERKFDFQIQINSNIDIENHHIPSMLIQPFVENSIWHGLMHKETKGKITIDFQYLDNLLKCTITDNGVGRKKAAEFSSLKTGHRSLGMHVTTERLKIINARKNMEDLSVKIKDLYENQEPSGTEVELFILQQAISFKHHDKSNNN